MITRRSLLTGVGTGATALGLAALGAAPASAASRTVPNFTHFAQSNGYYCGPATVRMAAKVRGAWVPQSTIAAAIGTSSSTGSSLAQVTAGLNKYVPGAKYTAVAFYRDSATLSSAEINTLYSRITKNVNDGYGTALNWSVPPGKYPHNSGLGNVRHHVLAIGYRTNSSTGSREVQIADPATSVFAGVPATYWIPLWKIVPWVAMRGYAW